MRRLNKIARKITSLNEAAEQFIKECEDSGKFDIEQTRQISYGFEDGLTMEEVKFYAKPEIHEDKMYKIRKDFESGLTIEEVKEKYNL